MRFTQLGRSGLEVSRICLGCMTYGTPKWRPWVLDEVDARPFYKKALDLGVNFFDTADMYSMGVSEEVTGRALREMANMEEVVLATKVHFPMGDGPNMGGISRKHIVQACEASLRRLGVETIDLYQIHRFKSSVPIEETLAALDHLVHQGKVRYIGASSGYAWQMAAGLGAIHLDAESLQPRLPRGRTGDDSALPGGRRGFDPMVASRTWTTCAHHTLADRGHNPG